MATMATVKAVRYSGGNYLCDVEVNGKLYQNVMVSAGAVNSGNVDLMKKKIWLKGYINYYTGMNLLQIRHF